MLSQFLNDTNYPGMKLVARLKRLADVNPEFRSRAKPLVDNLRQFFSREPEMNAREIRSLASNSPFTPFVLETTGGQLIPVDKPEHIHIAPPEWPDLFVIFSEKVIRFVQATDIVSVSYE